MGRAFHICVCASGGGGNFQALIDSQAVMGYTITMLITDRDCGALARAANHHIPSLLLDRKLLGDGFFAALEKAIPTDTDLIVLAGFMPILPAWLCERWPQKIINTHPSLLPAYGGKGMIGVRVQEAVLKNHEEYAGCSVHYVTQEIDGGEVIAQAKVKVNPGETAWELGGRVYHEETKLLPLTIKTLMDARG